MTSVRLRPGVMVGPYRIDALAGEGAMGRVYRAHDSRLNRSVALKVLPDDLVADADHLARFEREAKAASALNHPNIVTVYEVGEQSVPSDEPGPAITIPFIAMEYVEGTSLRDLLSTGPLSIKKALDVAVQTTEALMRAHEAGIVHRDLKPDNLMVRSDGYVKVLDFGLARVTSHNAGSSMARTLDGEYFVVGTASYMSPEQARGRKVDGRSDIFSFGCVLYEMLAGRPPFSGESVVDILSAILNEEPRPLAEFAPHVPRDLGRTIERCLAKDPDERYQSMRDLSLDLKAIRRDFESGLISASTRRAIVSPLARPRSRRRVTGLAVLAVAVAGAATLLVAHRLVSSPAVRVARLTSSGVCNSAAISPDGARVAYVEETAPPKLLLRDRRGSSALSIDTGGVTPSFPAFSSDGLSLYFSGNDPEKERTIYRVDVLGGSARILTPGFRPRPSPDGRSLAFLRDRPGVHPSYDLCVSGENGEQARCTLVAPAPDLLFAFAWNADSKTIRIALGSGQTNDSRFGAYDVKTGRLSYAEGKLPMMVSGFAPDPASSDLYLTGSPIYARGGELVRKHGDSVTALTSGVSDYRGLSVDAAGTTAVTTNFRENSNIEVVTLTGNPARDTHGVFPLTEDNEGDYRPIWSPDGTRIAFTSTRTGYRSIWVMNADGTGARELTPIKADYGWPSWSPDGKTISYASNLTGNHEIYTVGLGGGQPRRITTSKVFNGQASFTPDGKTLYYESADAAGNPILKRADLATGRSEVFVNADAEFPSVSPDGRLVAVTSEPESEGQIPVLVFRISDRTTIFQTRIIPNGHLITWTPDSASIVAVRKEGTSLRENAYRFPLNGAPPEKLTDFHEEWRIRGCAIDPSGTKLLLVRIKGNSDIVAIGPLRGPTLWEWLTGRSR